MAGLRVLLTLAVALPLCAEKLQFGAEWRFIRAGTVNLEWSGETEARLRLVTTGLVSTLYKVDDDYRSKYGEGLCLASSLMRAKEGRRDREITVTIDAEARKSRFVERDAAKDTQISEKELDVPACVHDVLGALHLLRRSLPLASKTFEAPVTDGKKLATGKVEAQQKEQVKTPLGTFAAVRYEAFLFNGVLYGRKGRLFVWISDDEHKLPVQVKIQLPFYIGTVTLKLEKRDAP